MLPYRPGAQLTTTSRDGPPRQRPRVLVADDYPGFPPALRRLLEPTCEIVGVVTNGIALLEAAPQLQPDVILVDLNLPGIDGLEACRQLRHTVPAAHVLILTADDDAATRERAFAHGATAFVSKYSLTDTLLPEIQRCAESLQSALPSQPR